MINLYDEIKADVLKYNFNYIEYNETDDNWDKTFIIDGNWVIWHYEGIDGYFIGRIEKDRFMTMDKKAIMQLISADHYYNYIGYEE